MASMPTRTKTESNEEDAIPSEDTSETTRLFLQRLEAWKHACGYLEDYISATEKMQTAHGKEYEKVLKTVSKPLKNGEHFDSQVGGVAEMFDNIRSNTQVRLLASSQQTALTNNRVSRTPTRKLPKHSKGL